MIHHGIVERTGCDTFASMGSRGSQGGGRGLRLPENPDGRMEGVVAWK